VRPAPAARGGRGKLLLTAAARGARRLEEGGVITQCEIQTLEGSGPVDFNFRQHTVKSRSIIKVRGPSMVVVARVNGLVQSQFLRDAFAELSAPGAKFVTIRWFTQAPYLSFSVVGDSSSCQVRPQTGAGRLSPARMRLAGAARWTC
jgi:hypothetical protein